MQMKNKQQQNFKTQENLIITLNKSVQGKNEKNYSRVEKIFSTATPYVIVI